MLKKVGALAAITAGMLLTASPAFAGEPGSDDVDRATGYTRDVDDIDNTHQVGLVNIDDSDILEQVNVCDIYIIGAEVNLLPIDSATCQNTEVEVEVDEDHHHHWDHD